MTPLSLDEIRDVRRREQSFVEVDGRYVFVTQAWTRALLEWLDHGTRTENFEHWRLPRTDIERRLSTVAAFDAVQASLEPASAAARLLAWCSTARGSEFRCVLQAVQWWVCDCVVDKRTDDLSTFLDQSGEAMNALTGVDHASDDPPLGRVAAWCVARAMAKDLPAADQFSGDHESQATSSAVRQGHDPLPGLTADQPALVGRDSSGRSLQEKSWAGAQDRPSSKVEFDRVINHAPRERQESSNVFDLIVVRRVHPRAAGADAAAVPLTLLIQGDVVAVKLLYPPDGGLSVDFPTLSPGIMDRLQVSLTFADGSVVTKALKGEQATEVRLADRADFSSIEFRCVDDD